MKKVKLQNNKGITLIALVITIIVLIILAGVSINLLLGENGIIMKTKDAKERTIVAQEKDQIGLAYSAAKIETLGIEITQEQFQNELNNVVYNDTATVTGDGPFYIHYEKTDHNYTIDSEGSIFSNTDEILFANRSFIYRSSGKICSYNLYVSDDKLSGNNHNNNDNPDHDDDYIYNYYSEYDGIILEYDTNKSNENVLVDNIKEYEIFDDENFWAITYSGDLYIHGNEYISATNISSLEDSEFACITKTPNNALYGKKVKKVYLKSWKGLAIDEDGKLYMWWNGDDSQTDLPNGTHGDVDLPITCISDITNNALYNKKITDVYEGDHGEYVLDENGKLYGWGWGLNYLSNGSWVSSETPVCINDAENSPLNNKKVTKFVITYDAGSSLAIDEDGNLYAFNCIYDTKTTICYTSDTTSVLYNKKIVDIYIDKSYVDPYCSAIDEDGKLYTWGYGGSTTSLGNGQIMQSNTFYEPICINNVEDSELNEKRVVQAGLEYAIDENGKFYSWGRSVNGYNTRTYPICLSERDTNINRKNNKKCL